MAMQKHGLLSEAGGFSRKMVNLDRSVELGLIQQKFTDLMEGVRWADWIILSIPVDAINDMLPKILDEVREEQLVVDFGSTKGKICDTVRNHFGRTRFIAAHPIAGTEYSGPDAAFADLFIDKLMVICEDGKSNLGALNDFEKVCRTIGMNLEYMESEAHDRHLAYISHLSHITSFALSNAVLEKERDGDVILELAGSGFESTVRLAKSSPEMWVPIFLENKKMVLEALSNFQDQTERFKELLIKDDFEGLTSFLEKGREIKRVIK